MNFKTLAPLKVFLLSIFIVSQISCSKDSDLLTDYVVSETQNTLDLSALILDDTFIVNSRESITLDVLANDGFENTQNVVITQTSEPLNGSVAINTDNTLTYTPETVAETTSNTTEEIEDTFTYTTEVVNEDETVSTGTGNVTVTSENKTPISGDNVYYVTTTGKANNDGKSEATAWSIQHAFASAKAGDVVYIKAGDYVVDNNLTPNSGTNNNPIKIIGYNTEVGDIISLDEPTITYDDYLDNGNDLDSSDMPLIRRSSIQIENDSNRKGMNLGGISYVEIENLQFKWQERAVEGFQHGPGIKVKNIIVAWVGNFNPIDTWTSGNLTYDPPLPSVASGGESTNQVGRGIDLSGSIGAEIENCLVINAGHTGIVVGTITSLPQTLNATIKGCRVYSDSQINPCDYYIEAYNSQNTLVEDCEVYRIKGLVHQGHGIDFKRGSNNTARNCYVQNTWLEVNIASHGNTFENITIKGMQDYSPNRRSGGVKIYHGSHGNTFKDIEFIDADGVLFADVWDVVATPNGSAGHDNTFMNCVFRNTQVNLYRNSDSPITFEANRGLEAGGFNDSPVYNNKFINCTFENAAAMFTVNRPNYDNEFIDCNFINIPLVYSTRSWGDKLNAIFTNCNFENSQVP
ncbi:Ig-like domain-containing protein [Maribacter luteus]|uniref:Right handed beta helix domain-containing protein n=1 Tax=Maribacter luteus TaxID=2594478 RepID=A0A6I2MLU1_9FLAO|nr:Ig-like domain-containing protein [Maribacter luteus]MRX63767.1 hypothetical protein [Maribacter luteus]